ncbi:MAG: hypothetical protein HWD59_08435 [Coxiellaceae bacterium]|nr:MAG: hypothetical protein HWD59_08435 [Coxiellaceae bacterium]
MQVNYLAAMGIATWQVCTALPGAKTPQYNSFKLLNPSGSCVGLLLYELSDDISLEVSFQAEQLLKAMLQAIKLQAVPCYLTQQMTISKVLLLGEK